MTYETRFEAVYGNTRLGPFYSQDECIKEAHKFFKTDDFRIVNWFIPDLDPVDMFEAESEELPRNG
jgi:hypothetical protein